MVEVRSLRMRKRRRRRRRVGEVDGRDGVGRRRMEIVEEDEGGRGGRWTREGCGVGRKRLWR